MKAVLADTGPLYALADTSDQFHVRARTEMESIQKQGLQVAAGYPALCEAHTLALRRLGGSYAREWLAEMLEGAMLLNPEPADYTMAAARLDRFPGPGHHAGGCSHRSHGRQARDVSLVF